MSRVRVIRFTQSGCVVLLGLALAACSTSRSPAPVQSRTGDSAPVSTRGLPAPAPVPPPPVIAGTPSEGVTSPSSGVQTSPVRSGGVESRPLETRPGASLPPPGAGTPALGALRTGPKVLKRPYTDAALAEMRGPDPAKPAVAVAPVEPPKPADTKSDAKADPKVDAGKAQDSGKTADLAWPGRGRVIQGYSEPKSMGIILDGKVGDPVLAAGDGRVIFSGPGPRGYGNLVIVKHDTDTVTVYAHNKSLLVKEGQTVKRGHKIAEVGDTGSDKVGLHFEVRRQGKPVDPQKILPKR
jgi:lipoprotein NlpD